MKNKLFLIGLLGTILVCGFLIIGCVSSASISNVTIPSLEGTWRNPQGSHPVYTFIGNNVTFRNDKNSSWEGTFIQTSNEITFTKETGTQATWTQEYKFKGNKLTLKKAAGVNYGTFVKQQ
jgi:hypothetical protein